MSKMKQNGFWIGITVATAVVVVFFGVMVIPLWTKKAGLQKSVKTTARKLKEEQKIPSTQDIGSFDEAKGKYIRAYQDIGDFYSKSNDHLERWFPDLKIPASQDPQRDGFMAIYRKERDEIEKALKDKGVQIGVPDPTVADKRMIGFNWEDPSGPEYEKVSADEKKVLKEIQKRFWARQRVANAILAILGENGKVTRIHDFRFFKKLHPNLPGHWDTPPQGVNAVHYSGIGAQQNFQAPQNFQEYELPQKLGRTLTFGFALELPYSQVPRVFSEILNPAAEKNVQARLLVNVIGSHVTIREQNQPLIEKKYMQGEPGAREQAIKEAQETLKPVDVLLSVTCQIIDFEPAEIRKFDAVADAKGENK